MGLSDIVGIYLRVSHKSSAESGLSIEEQYNQCRSYISASFGQYTPIDGCYPENSAKGVFIDRAVSAWKVAFKKRPAGYALTQSLQPGNHIVMYSIDRGFRNVRDFTATTSEWAKAGIVPHFIADGLNGSTASGRFMIHVKAAAAQYYSDIISERTREALLIRKYNKAQGLESKSPKKPKYEWVPSDVKFPTPDPSPVILKSGRIWRYERCSTNAQYVSGLGLQQQAERNLAYAKFLTTRFPGLQIVPDACVDEAYSAYSIPFAQRPAGKRIMEEAREGDHVVIYRLDRAWRSPKDAIAVTEELIKRGVHVHSVVDGIATTTEAGMHSIALMSWVAHVESSMKARRKREVNARLKQEGRPYNVPHRYMMVRNLGRKKRKLAWNYPAIRTFALAWAAVNFAGTDLITARELAYTLAMAEKGEPWSLEMPGFANNRWARTAVTTFDDLRGQIPEKAWRALAEQACKRLEQPLPPAYVKYCRRVKAPYIVDWAKFREVIGDSVSPAVAS